MGKWFKNHGVDDHIDSLWKTQGGTIDLKQEFENLVLGHGTSEPGGIYDGLGQYLVHRIMDRTGARCPCWDQNRGSSSNCRYCKGESFAWTEEWVRGYFTQTFGRSLTGATIANQLLPAGIFDKDKAMIYLPSDAVPATGDSMFRIRLNAEGKPYYPIERVEKWRCVNVEDRRQENGELAFWLVLAERVEF